MKKIITNMTYDFSKSKNESGYPKNQTDQKELDLENIMVRYMRGDDLSDLVVSTARNAPASIQYMNNYGRVDPLTERQEYLTRQQSKLQEEIFKIEQLKMHNEEKKSNIDLQKENADANKSSTSEKSSK